MFAYIDTFAKIMFIHDKSLAKEFDPDELVTKHCEEMIPLSGVTVKSRIDLDDYKQKSFAFSVSDVPGYIQSSYTFRCQTAAERNKWVERLSTLSTLAVDMLEMERDCKVLREKLSSATTLLKMNVGEKLLENITSGRYRRGSRRYQEVREHLNDYFAVWEDVMRKKMDVHNELLNGKKPDHSLTKGKHSSRKGKHDDRNKMVRVSDRYSEELSSMSNETANGKVSETSSERTVGQTTSRSGTSSTRTVLSDTVAGAPRYASPSASGNASTSGSHTASPNISGSASPNVSAKFTPTVMSDVMKKVLAETGGKIPGGDEKTKKSLLLKKIINEMKRNPHSKYDISKITEKFGKLGQN